MPNLNDVLSEIQSRQERKFVLSDYLFDKQLAFVLDPSPFKIAVTTRRSGKSISCVADLSNECQEFEGINCLYITLSRNNAKKLVWPEFKRINRAFKLGGEVNETELTITYPNGSVLYVSGAADRTAIENFRGMALKKVYIDEGQSFPSYIAELIDEVIGPALMDHSGSLSLIGTPGPIPTGYFYELWTKNEEWSKHFWTFFDNPKLPFLKKGLTHQDMLDRELKRRGVGSDNPSIQREWFGKWVLDTDALVYRYNSTKNGYKALPQARWQYVLGVDLGYEDADALAVLAWTESSPVVYLIEELIVKQQGISELVNQIEDLRKKYDFTKIVMDTGGLGKKISEEIIRRYKISVEPAEKVRKFEYIELMNDALRTSMLQALPDSRFAQDCMKVEWDLDKCTPTKKVISSRFHSDICEAVLYAWRCCYGFTYQKPIETPKKGTQEWLEELEEKALEHFTAIEDANKNDPFQY